MVTENVTHRATVLVVIHKLPFLSAERDSFHDAGYDSFCTGFVFVKLAHMAALINKRCFG